MAVLEWDKSGEKIYETGVRKGVLYVYSAEADEDNESHYSNGVAWNGLSSVSESPSGAEESAIYADDDKYLSLRSKEEFGATVEAYTYPDEFEQCDGSATLGGIVGLTVGQQARKTFGLCYRTVVGNDTELDEHGYKIHLLYGCTAAPSEKQYQTINDSPEAITFSWEISTVPVETGDANLKKTATVVVDSTKFTTTQQKAALKKLEDALYGTADTAPYLPLPSEVKTLLTPTA